MPNTSYRLYCEWLLLVIREPLKAGGKCLHRSAAGICLEFFTTALRKPARAASIKPFRKPLLSPSVNSKRARKAPDNVTVVGRLMANKNVCICVDDASYLNLRWLTVFDERRMESQDQKEKQCPRRGKPPRPQCKAGEPQRINRHRKRLPFARITFTSNAVACREMS